MRQLAQLHHPVVCRNCTKSRKPSTQEAVIESVIYTTTNGNHIKKANVFNKITEAAQ